MATSTIKQGDIIHHQGTVTLHHLGSLAQLKSDGSLFAYTVSTDNSEDLILYHSQNNGTMDFLLEGENGASSRESIANLLDEGLGTSLDGTDEISSSIHTTLGRNDSGVFSSDEMTTCPPHGAQPTTSTTTTTTAATMNNINNSSSNNSDSSSSSSSSSHNSANSPSVMTTTTPAAPGTAIPHTITIEGGGGGGGGGGGNSSSSSSNSSSTSTSSGGSVSSGSSVSGGTQTTKKQRQKNSSPNRQGPQRCAICGKIFSNASALTKHKLTHSDERKHACSICGKAFKRQDHLNGHMLTHRNKKPFECRAKGCGKSYCDGRSLRRHIESRHGPDALATLSIQPTPNNNSTSSSSNSSGSSSHSSPGNSNNNNNNNNVVNVNLSSATVNSNGEIQIQNPNGVSLQTLSSISQNPNPKLPLITLATGTVNNSSSVEHLSIPISITDSSVILNQGDSSGTTADVLNCASSILGLDHHLLENNFGQHQHQRMDIQVALEPVIVKEERQEEGDEEEVGDELQQQQQQQQHPIKIEPLHIRSSRGDSSKILGLTLSAVNGNGATAGTLCGILGSPDSKHSQRHPTVVVPSSISSLSSNNHNSRTTLRTTTTVPVTIRASHSQLHQLLTQRASNGCLENSNSTTIANASLVSLTTAMTRGGKQNDPAESLYKVNSTNWATHHNELTKSSTCDEVVSPRGRGTPTTTLLVTTTNGKCPSSPVRMSSSAGPGTASFSTSTTTSSPSNNMVAVATPVNATPTSTPNLLKEQLELIHQIIQQAQEESNLTAAAAAATAAANSLANGSTKSTTGKSSKGTSKKLKAFLGNGVVIKVEPGEELGKSEVGVGSDDKPVECTICCRRFKNTPALNGHMRLHGGYFKKDAEGKKKDMVSSNKEPSNTPLQTASVSVRALIEEKIIQKRNTIQTQNVDKALVLGVGVNQLSSTETQTGYVTTTTQQAPQQEPQGTVSLSLQPANNNNNHHHQSLAVNIGHTFTTSHALNITHGAPASFQFVYGDDNTDYLLMEEEVFNKVSSICPDSFLNGIDESILNGTGAEELAPEWQWAAGTSDGGDPANSRLTSLFVGADAVSDEQFVKLQSSSTNPFTPLPPLDATTGNFYASPTPQSPSVNSQDSPSFIYPTPPASLESHNALQSPLFPFPSIPASAPAPVPTASVPATVVFPFESQSQPNNSINKTNTSNPLTINPIISNTSTSTSSINQTNFAEASTLNQIITATLTSSLISPTSYLHEGPESVNSVGGALAISNVSTTNSNSNSVVPGIIGVGISPTTYMNPGDSILTTTQTAVTEGTTTLSDSNLSHFARRIKARNLSGGSNLELNILTPSNSPSLTSGSMDDSLQSMKELRANEPSRVESSNDGNGIGVTDVFLNPNSVPSSPACFKSPTKRKQLRNTFASNLRPQTNTAQNSHFTPYPILSPVRSAPGLYWTFSTKLSHVDDSKKELPRINIGSNFQATIPELSSNKSKLKIEDEDIESDKQERLWIPEVVDACCAEEVEKYLEFACCSAIPGGGRNKEYALHILNHCNGDIVAAMVLLMNPKPLLPNHLKEYKYQEKEKWPREDINLFQEALLKYGKDFIQVAKDIEGKSSEECVIFYQLWKKVCSAEYEKVRNVWKRRDAAFTLELLKNVPPPTSLTSSSRVSFTSNTLVDSLDSKTQVSNELMDTTLAEINGVPTLSLSHEEYPCKVCGKIFTKVKSRSAHMKSHRPPESSDGSSSNPGNNKKLKIGTSTAGTATSTSLSTKVTLSSSLTTPTKIVVPPCSATASTSVSVSSAGASSVGNSSSSPPPVSSSLSLSSSVNGKELQQQPILQQQSISTSTTSARSPPTTTSVSVRSTSSVKDVEVVNGSSSNSNDSSNNSKDT